MNEGVQYFAVEDAGTTVVHPLGLLMLVVCGILLLSLPRKYALWPFIVLVCFVSSRQCIAVAGLNLYFARVMVLVFGIGRALINAEGARLRLNVLDWTIIAYAAVYFIGGSGKWGFDLADVKTRSGYLVEVVGIYFLMRTLVRSPADLNSVVQCLAWVSLPVAGVFILERLTGRNIFSVFGGVPAITAVRDGRLRCQGAYGHPILAGVVWASVLPLLVYSAVALRPHRHLCVAGVIAAVTVVLLSSSSTPALGLATAAVGAALYPLRRYARTGFAATAVLLLALHLCMKAPVWALIQRVSVTPGDSGYHRYILVDGFIRHWDEWWLWGTTLGTQHWGHFTFDISNQFVAVGANAGILALACFTASIVLALLGAGRIQKCSPVLGWALGVCVMIHCLCFLGISIWGQLHFAWNLPLAVIGSLGFKAGAAPARSIPQGFSSRAHQPHAGIVLCQSRP